MVNNFKPDLKVLVISNQQTTGPLWVFSLKQERLNVVLEPSPANALDRWAEEVPDLTILDVHIPDLMLIELIKSLRSETLMPILLLMPPKPEEFILTAYQAGVDDCIQKPVNPSLFNAKIKAWLRHAPGIPASMLNPVRVGKAQLLPADRQIVIADGDPIRLTNLEFRLLYELMNRPSKTLTTEELNRRIWGYLDEPDNTMLKNVVYRLRRKIEADPTHPEIIETVTGVGYKFMAENQ